MSNQSEDIQATGSDTHPPMLDKTYFESWQQGFRQKISKRQVLIPTLQCLTRLILSHGNKDFGYSVREKNHGEYILQSIDEGSFKMGRCRDEIATGTDDPYLGPEREEVVVDLSQAKKDRHRADIHATNILLQGFPRDIYKLINHKHGC
nr:hypothetical protein [Tanacetum cinerariifolium]